MVELFSEDQKLDRVFAALADPSRRRMLADLRKGSLSISELAEPFSMSFTGAAKHIEVLTTAGLVQKVKDPNDGRSFRIELQNKSLTKAYDWLTYHQKFWTNKLDRLEALMEEQDNDGTDSKSRKKN
ncbi:ArsR/SmtB family transcription factor [Leptospira idonii]|uniref:ArsR family transcriptional regulator n=1 Tax=Leptospira idonii TaxID=1193500 RepID=A0A4R9LWV9_9LEPT|nr:metalloregulator ArsR/SmtB family transcription factor [Leptospira idonii]TGN18783.1 ArsR family transcriptional regulator [Leptospira idonii]